MEGVPRWRHANNAEHAIFGGAYEIAWLRSNGQGSTVLGSVRPAFLLMKGHLLNN